MSGEEACEEDEIEDPLYHIFKNRKLVDRINRQVK